MTCAETRYGQPQGSWSGSEQDDMEADVNYHLTQLRAKHEAKRRFDEENRADSQDANADHTSLLYTDVGAMLDGALPQPPTPEVLTRSDGLSLFYRGEVNVVFGDPEHGKTWVVLAACAELLKAGGRVLVADLDHNGAAAIVSRLLLLGAPQEALRDQDRFRHCEPVEVADIEQVVTDCEAWLPDAVVIDSTGELLPLYSASSDSADDFTKVHNKVLQPLAKTGAAVLLVDHLAKGRESRTFGPGGSMAKRRTVGGSSIRVVRVHAFTRSEGGAALLWVNKDRHGGVRDHCAPARPGKEEQLAGTFVLGAVDADDGMASWQVVPDSVKNGGNAGEPLEFRPTNLMERASRAVERQPGTLTKNKLAKEIGAKKEHALAAINVLEHEEYVRPEKTPGQRYPLYDFVRPYREADDPLSDQPSLGDRLRAMLTDDHTQGGDAV